MPIPLNELIRMPKGTRELYPLAESETVSKFQRKVTAYARKAGVVRFQSCLIVHQDKSVLDGVWIEVINPLEPKGR